MYRVMLSVAVLFATMGNAQAAVSAFAQLQTAVPACNKCVSSAIEIPEGKVVAEPVSAAAAKPAVKPAPISSEGYFPIQERVTMVYEFTTSDQEGSELFEISFDQVNQSASETLALAKVHRLASKDTPTSFFTKRNGKGVFSYDFIQGSDRMEFPAMVFRGATWNSNVGIELVETLRGWVDVPAGKFTKCLKIVTQIGGGDQGTAVRYYAPGVGLVYEEVRAEDVQSQLRLVSVTKK